MDFFRTRASHAAAHTSLPTVEASKARSLEDLQRLADTKNGDTQVRLSGKLWKLKPDAKTDPSMGAKRHIKAAIAGNEALFRASLRERGFSVVPDGLIRLLRGAEQTPLTTGQLKAELRAIRLLDRVITMGMNRDAALRLVHDAWRREKAEKDIDLDDLPQLAAVMVARGLTFPAAVDALKALRPALTEDDFEQGDAPVSLHTGPSAAHASSSPARTAAAAASPQSASSASPNQASPAASRLHPRAATVASSSTAAAGELVGRIDVHINGGQSTVMLHPAVAYVLDADWTLTQAAVARLQVLSKVLDETTGEPHVINIRAVVGSLKANSSIGSSEAEVRAGIDRLTQLQPLRSPAQAPR
jgi:hypothetical protein